MSHQREDCVTVFSSNTFSAWRKLLVSLPFLSLSLPPPFLLVSSASLHQSSGSDFQWWTFPFLWVPELYPCLSHSNSQLNDSSPLNYLKRPSAHSQQLLIQLQLLLMTAPAWNAQKTMIQTVPHCCMHIKCLAMALVLLCVYELLSSNGWFIACFTITAEKWVIYVRLCLQFSPEHWIYTENMT
jgi:hypothetical protein